MARPLSATAVANLRPDPKRRIEVSDGLSPGLRLVIQPSGAKSWAFRYEVAGRSAKMTLGIAVGSGALTLVEAREQVAAARKRLAAGIDPIAARRADREAEAARLEAERLTVAANAREASENMVPALLDRYISRHVDHLKSAREVKRLFKVEVRDVWKERSVTSLTKADVVKLIEDIADRKAPTTANRTLANLKAFFNWCIDRGILDRSPADRVRRPSAEVARERVLTDEELRLLMLAIDRLDWPWRQFFAVALLTGQRRTECAGMRRAELDLDGSEAIWVLPSERTKNGREHLVPLTARVVTALAQAPKIGDEYVITTTGTSGVSGFARAKAALDAEMLKIMRDERKETGEDPEGAVLSPWRLHDLRRTMATVMARKGVSVAVVEKVLNHVSGTFGGIVGVYQRHDYAEEKRAALELWAAHLDGLARPTKSNVIALDPHAHAA